jgi:hypothetical protein
MPREAPKDPMKRSSPNASLSLIVLVVALLAGVTLAAPSLAAPPTSSPSHSAMTGAATRASVPPARIGSAVEAAQFNVTFDATGLPDGTLWQVATITPATGYVVVTSTMGGNISQSWSNGTYTFTASANIANYTSDRINATFTVSGAPLPVTIHFLPAFAVRFTETGISNLTSWTVAIRGNGSSPNLTWAGPNISIFVPVGPFNYTISAEGYEASPANGSANVAGAIRIPVTFSAALPPVGYITGDVDVGTASLYINGIRDVIQVGGGFSFALEPGLYSVIVTATGYATNYTEVDLASNETIILDVNLIGDPSPVTPNVAVPGIDSTGWIIIGLLAVAAAALGVTTAVFAGRARRPPPTTPWTHPLAPAEESTPPRGPSGSGP